MNRDRYRLTLKGRKPRRGTPRRFRPDVSMKWASRVGLYVDDKMGAILHKYHRETGAHPERCKVERLLSEATHRSELLEEHHTTLLTVRQRLEDTRDQLAALQMTAARDHLKAIKLQDEINGYRCDHCGDKFTRDNPSSFPAVDPRSYLDTIHGFLDGVEWDSETLDQVAQTMRHAGYSISHPDDPGRLDEPDALGADPADPIGKAIKDGSLSPADLPGDLLPAHMKGGH
jgi:hypothetical protein